ncbi:MAG: hypothetical protein BroJett013_00100 [Alphaproteobacteria bacterium]|nr:MAG: hypothetical protein BroJett013_00100 [Alphaproteobacteria bacterium]
MAKTSAYQKSESDGVTTFIVTPAEAPKFIYGLVLGVIFLLLGLMLGGFGVIVIAAAGFLIWFSLRDLRPKEHRATATFRVAPDRVEVAGETFRRDDIHRIIIRNGVTGKEVLEHYTTNMNAAAGLAHRAHTARVANALTLESGGRATFLAGGMDEVTAYGLLRDVCRILGFDTN